MTIGFSWSSHLKDDHRHREGAHHSANRPIGVAPGVVSYVWYTPFHPLNRLPAAVDTLARPLFRIYGSLPLPGLRPIVAAADLIMFESTSGLMLVDRFRAWNPHAGRDPSPHRRRGRRGMMLTHRPDLTALLGSRPPDAND